MPLVITEAKIHGFPNASVNPTADSVDVLYRVKTNKAAPGTKIIRAAIDAQKLPSPKTLLNITHDGVTYTSDTLEATQYNYSGFFESEKINTSHDVIVTFQTPTLSSIRTTNPALNKNPLNRPLRRWVEWITREEPITAARNVLELTGIRPKRAANTLGPLINGAGDPLEATRTVRIPILCVGKFVSSFENAVAMDIKWRDTTNQTSWRSIPRRRAAFLSADTAGPNYWNDVTYYDLTVRVLWEPAEIILSLPNVGPNVMETDGTTVKKAVAQTDGIILPFTNLDMAGKKVDTAENIDYRHLTDKNYGELDTDIANYG